MVVIVVCDSDVPWREKLLLGVYLADSLLLRIFFRIVWALDPRSCSSWQLPGDDWAQWYYKADCTCQVSSNKSLCGKPHPGLIETHLLRGKAFPSSIPSFLISFHKCQNCFAIWKFYWPIAAGLIFYLHQPFLLIYLYMQHTYMCYTKSLQSCLTLCGSMDCSPSGSSVHGISRQEYWSGLLALFQGIFLIQDWTHVSMSFMFPALSGGFFTTSATIYIRV